MDNVIIDKLVRKIAVYNLWPLCLVKCSIFPAEASKRKAPLDYWQDRLFKTLPLKSFSKIDVGAKYGPDLKKAFHFTSRTFLSLKSVSYAGSGYPV